MKTAQRSWMTAITFAEAGEWETARAMMPVSSGADKSISLLNRVFMAVSFAEAGLHEEALTLLDERKKTRARFLDAVGLGGIRVTYGVLPA